MKNSHEIHNEGDVVEVLTGERAIVSSPTNAEIMGMGPCVGIILYSPRMLKAIVGHMVDPINTKELDTILQKANKEFDDTTDLIVFLGGASPENSNQDELESIKATRSFVLEKLRSHGFNDQQLRIRFGDSGQTTTMHIDTKTGKVDYEVIEQE